MSWHGNTCPLVDSPNAPRHTGWQPRCNHGDLGNPPDCHVVAGYLKNTPLCDCNRDCATLAWHSDAWPLWAQLCFHYNLYVSVTLIPQPPGTQDKRSVWPLAIISDQNVTVQRCYYDLALRCLGAPAASIMHTRHPYDDPMVTISILLYTWLHSMAS